MYVMPVTIVTTFLLELWLELNLEIFYNNEIKELYFSESTQSNSHSPYNAVAKIISQLFS